MYPAKILLFGEYTIILGGDALAIPFDHFYGKWEFNTSEAKSYKQTLSELSQHIVALKIDGFHFDSNKFDQAIERGLHFKSTIPSGYGLGSSGALVAAIFKEYCTFDQTAAQAVQSILASIESHFHGKSSGLDPYLSLCQKPIYHSEGSLRFFNIGASLKSLQFFLIDSGQSRITSHLVESFKSKMLDSNYASQIQGGGIEYTDYCIQSILQSKAQDLFTNMHSLSHFQWQHFDFLIPQKIKPLWLAGLGSSLFKLKLCGAGGGGYFLGITNDLNEFLSGMKEEYKIIPITLP